MSRADLVHLIRFETSRLVLASALIFLFAGSLWMHLALGPVFFTPGLFCSWALIHVTSFLALRPSRLANFFGIASFAGLQLYYASTLHGDGGASFFPLAPVFFVGSTVVLTGLACSQSTTPWRAVMLWASSWISTAAWLFSYDMTQEPLLRAVGTVFAVQAMFLGFFFVLSFYSAKRMAGQLQELGPRTRYDDQRIQAAKLQTLGELTASLGHEINNPLAAINGYSHQITSEIAEEAQPSIELIKSANERIKFNVDRIIQITRVLRSFTRDSGRDEFVELSLKDVVEDTLTLMRHNLKAERVDLQVEVPGEEVRVKGSLIQLSQLLVNLISNARDAALESDRKKVVLGYSVTQERVRLWVQDSGRGIPEAVAADIFRPFFTTKGVGKGTGLGLYIAKTISDRHQAQLSFEILRDGSNRVMGTRFILDIPSFSAVTRQAA